MRFPTKCASVRQTANLAAGWLLALAACNTKTIPPARVASAPAFHEVYLVGLDIEEPSYVVLEHLDGAAVRLLRHDPAQNTNTTLRRDDGETALALASWSDRATLAAALKDTPLGQQLERASLAWASACADASPGRYGVRLELELDERRVVLRPEPALNQTVPRGGDAFREVLRLPPGEVLGHVWLCGRDARRLGLEVRYAGHPVVQAVYVIDAGRSAGRWWSGVAYDLHGQGEYAEAQALWLRAHGADPEAADVLYNLACAAARLGQPDRAMQRLQQALEARPEPYRDLARDDPDFATLRRRQDFTQLVRPTDVPAPPSP